MTMLNVVVSIVIFISMVEAVEHKDMVILWRRFMHTLDPSWNPLLWLARWISFGPFDPVGSNEILRG